LGLTGNLRNGRGQFPSKKPTVDSNGRWQLIHGSHTHGFVARGWRPISGTVTLQSGNSVPHFT
jgi:hypothetical protein